MKIAAAGIGGFLLGATVGVLGIATLTARWIKAKGAGPKR